ncbi:MAG: histidine kinase N-terminal 7TM domain-containing protein [bacterium]|nr:histidine kinase N-terminal 7TM domain-containing protein [bacterium]
MSLLLLITIVATISTLTLGIFVLKKDFRSRTHQLFSLFCLFVAIWSVANYFALTIIEKDIILFWVRMVMAFATAQSVTLLLFILTFPRRLFLISKTWLIVILSLGIITFITSLLPYVFSDIVLSADNKVSETIIAPGIILFIIVSIGSIVASIIFSVRNLLNIESKIKIQFKYIFLGIVLMYIGIIFFSFILPVFFQNPNYVYLGSLFTLPFIMLTSYAMLRYRFMDFRVVIKKSVIYVISLIIALSIYTYLVLVFKETIEESWNVNTTWTAVILVALVALGFPPLKTLVEKVIDKLFKGKKSIDLAVQEVKEKMSHETELDNLINIIIKEIEEYLNIENIQFFMLDKISNTLIGKNGEMGKNISQKSNLLKYFIKYNEVLITEEIPHLINERPGQFEKEIMQQTEKEMKKYNFNLAMPIVADQEIIAIIGLAGERRSFTVQDVDYLNKLREQITFAIANALLYQNAMERIQGNGE